MLRQISAKQRLLAIPKRFYSTNGVAIPNPPVASPENPNLNKQAPNRADTWAPSQRPRAEAQVGPRFEQRDLEVQPRPYAAIELIAKQPVRYLHSSSAVCDGGKGAQGHPKIFINLDKPGAHACLYCK
jgi:NADH dehydrogenase (ubiquinone) Fe-S protein 6